MAKVAVDLTVDQIKSALEQLEPAEFENVSRKVWALELKRLAAKMRKAAKKNKVTQKDVSRICEEARKTVYDSHRS